MLRSWALFLGLLALIPAASAWATLPTFDIPQAANLYLSPHGQDYLAANLVTLLNKNQVDLTRRDLPEWAYTATSAVSLSHLPVEFRQYSGLLKEVKDTLEEWLIGFHLNDPRFKVQIKGSKFEARYKKLAVRPDFDLTAGLQGDGIAIELEAVIPEIRIEADKIRASDLNNPFLGQFGLNHPWLSLKDDGHPLKVQVPIRVKVTSSGGLELESLGVQTNLTQVKFGSGFDRPMILPQVQLKVGDKVSRLDTGDIERLLIQRQPDLVRMLQNNLRQYVETELPARMTTMAYDQLTQNFDTVRDINPSGTDVAGTVFSWGLRLEELSTYSNFVSLEMRGYVSDPEVNWDAKYPKAKKHGIPDLGAVDGSTYDLVFALSEDVFNRAVYMSYQRGNFEKVDAGDGSTVKMIQAPVFKAEKDKFRMRFGVELDPKGIEQNVFLYGPFQVKDLELEAHFRISPKGFDLVMDGLDESSGSIADSYIRFKRYKDTVPAHLKANLTEKNGVYHRIEKILANDIVVPKDFYGIPIELNQIGVDPAGYVMLYMKFGAL